MSTYHSLYHLTIILTAVGYREWYRDGIENGIAKLAYWTSDNQRRDQYITTSYFVDS